VPISNALLADKSPYH